MFTIFGYTFAAAAVILQTPLVLGGWIDTRVHTTSLRPTALVDQFGELEDNLVEEPVQEDVVERCRTDRQAQWDPVSCIDLGGHVSDGVMLSIRCAIFAVNISQRFEATTKHFLNCPDTGFFNVLPCYINSTMTFVENTNDLKDGVMPFLAEAKEVLDNIKLDFNKCVGISSGGNILDEDEC